SFIVAGGQESKGMLAPIDVRHDNRCRRMMQSLRNMAGLSQAVLAKRLCVYPARLSLVEHAYAMDAQLLARWGQELELLPDECSVVVEIATQQHEALLASQYEAIALHLRPAGLTDVAFRGAAET